MKNRFFALLLVVIMALTFAPGVNGTAFADDEAEAEEQTSELELQNVKLNDGVVTWDEPDGASYYILMGEITTEYPSFNVESYFDEQHSRDEAVDEEYDYIIEAYNSDDELIGEYYGTFSYNYDKEDKKPVPSIYVKAGNYDLTLGEKPVFSGGVDEDHTSQFEGVKKIDEVWVREPDGVGLDRGNEIKTAEGYAYYYGNVCDLN